MYFMGKMPKIFGILLLATGAARAQIGAVSSPPYAAGEDGLSAGPP